MCSVTKLCYRILKGECVPCPPPQTQQHRYLYPVSRAILVAFSYVKYIRVPCKPWSNCCLLCKPRSASWPGQPLAPASTLSPSCHSLFSELPLTMQTSKGFHPSLPKAPTLPSPHSLPRDQQSEFIHLARLLLTQTHSNTRVVPQKVGVREREELSLVTSSGLDKTHVCSIYSASGVKQVCWPPSL